MLTKHGEFLPFGAVVRANGDVRPAAGYTGSEQPPSKQVIDLLVSGMRKEAAANEIRAAGICYDARIRPPDSKPTDAIAIALEHLDGGPVLALMPYKKAGAAIDYGELTFEPG